MMPTTNLSLTVDDNDLQFVPSTAPRLSDQEQRVLKLYAADLGIVEIAQHLGISPHTVKDYLRRIRSKLSTSGNPVRMRRQVVAEAQRLGLLP